MSGQKSELDKYTHKAIGQIGHRLKEKNKKERRKKAEERFATLISKAHKNEKRFQKLIENPKVPPSEGLMQGRPKVLANILRDSRTGVKKGTAYKLVELLFPHYFK